MSKQHIYITAMQKDKKADGRTLSAETLKKSSLVQQPATSLTATGTHMPYGITQCYLPPDNSDIPTFTPAK